MYYYYKCNGINLAPFKYAFSNKAVKHSWYKPYSLYSVIPFLFVVVVGIINVSTHIIHFKFGNVVYDSSVCSIKKKKPPSCRKPRVNARLSTHSHTKSIQKPCFPVHFISKSGFDIFPFSVGTNARSLFGDARACCCSIWSCLFLRYVSSSSSDGRIVDVDADWGVLFGNRFFIDIEGVPLLLGAG